MGGEGEEAEFWGGHWIFRMTEGGSVMTENPKKRITK